MGKLVVVGITGGVGSGKSTILTYLKQKYEVNIVIADVVAKQLMEPGGETYDAILAQFGEDLKGPGDMIDKVLLAKRLFEQGYGTSKINEIVHPAVKEKIRQRIEQEKLEAIADASDKVRLLVIEAALFFEAHADELCDELWYVHADEETRISRLMENRNYSREKCVAIMGNQMSEDEFRERCGFVIENGGEPEEAYAQIDEKVCMEK